MHTATSIVIHAPREMIFETVRDLSRWPELLPHYRFVHTIGQQGDREIVHMACVRSGIPISWVSAYEADPKTLELRFEHLKKWTKGMVVIWTLTQRADGTRVEIIHDLRFRIFGLRWLVEPIIGHLFIDYVAKKTLATFKKIIEAQKRSSPDPATAHAL